jgi:S1-C subfamily serine protease
MDDTREPGDAEQPGGTPPEWTLPEPPFAHHHAYGLHPYATPAPPPAPAPARRRLPLRASSALGVTMALIAGGLAGAGIAHETWSTAASNGGPVRGGGSFGGPPGSESGGSGALPFGGSGGRSFFGNGGPGPGFRGSGGSFSSGSGRSSSNASDGPSDAAAIAKNVDPGVVDITTTLTDGVAAGTGMMLTSTGEVLTNNHVIDGARSISVRDAGNGRSYSARVVGYDRTADIAVLQLANASGLSTIKVAKTQPGKGAAVVGIGNAGGVGGTPSYAGGAITATGQTVTASDSGDGTSERLTGLLATDAAIAAGDSGGPLVNASGEVVGMDTAASAGMSFRGPSTGSTQGFAIPIPTVLGVARQIEAGQSSTAVHVGPTAELGLFVTGGATGGVAVAGVAPGGPAATAGLQRGDVITSVAGAGMSTLDGLSEEMTRLRPGQTVPVSYLTSGGQQHTVQVRLGSGPPQ